MSSSSNLPPHFFLLKSTSSNLPPHFFLLISSSSFLPPHDFLLKSASSFLLGFVLPGLQLRLCACTVPSR
eukprot:3149555-Pleurochrysis_carterae.AAC.1